MRLQNWKAKSFLCALILNLEVLTELGFAKTLGFGLYIFQGYTIINLRDNLNVYQPGNSTRKLPSSAQRNNMNPNSCLEEFAIKQNHTQTFRKSMKVQGEKNIGLVIIHLKFFIIRIAHLKSSCVCSIITQSNELPSVVSPPCFPVFSQQSSKHVYQFFKMGSIRIFKYVTIIY